MHPFHNLFLFCFINLVWSQTVAANNGQTAKVILTEVISDYENWLQMTPLDPLAVVSQPQVDLSTWPDYTEQGFAKNKNKMEDIQAKLHRITEDQVQGMESEDQVNFRIVSEIIRQYIAGFNYTKYGPYNPISILDGIPLSLEHSVKNIDSKDNLTVLERYVTFVQKLPKLITQQIALMNDSISRNLTLYKTSLENKYTSVSALIKNIYETGNIEDTFFMAPFQAAAAKFNKSEQFTTYLGMLKKKKYELYTSLQTLAVYINQTYLPQARAMPGVGSLAGGDAYYKACLRFHLGTDATPDLIHNKGLAEVKRISEAMRKLIKDKADSDLPIKDFISTKLNNSTYYLDSPEAMLARFRNITNERIMPQVKKMFKTFPKTPLEIRSLPYDGPNSYWQAPNEGRDVGIFKVNTKAPLSSPTYNFMALALHEAYPGHHMQISIQQENKQLPFFRRHLVETPYYAVPFGIPAFTNYIEGWGLYSEKLGEEANLYGQKAGYDTEYEMLGRYGYEIWRAMRLVVDTGIHSKGWSRQKAIDYIKDFSTRPLRQIENEVDRYISWPGQACAYKMGESDILDLRKTAHDKIGEGFDLRRFHDFILRNGPMPMAALQQIVQGWIEEEKKRIASSTSTTPSGVVKHIPSPRVAAATALTAFTLYCSQLY